MEQLPIRRSGVTFSCDVCGKLLRDCKKHNPPELGLCKSCGGDLKRVGIGNQLVGYAIWFRCLNCKQLLMQRRGSIVPTTPRSGFKEFA